MSSTDAERKDTPALAAFREWWADNKNAQLAAFGERENAAWIAFRAGWYSSPSTTQASASSEERSGVGVVEALEIMKAAHSETGRGETAKPLDAVAQDEVRRMFEIAKRDDWHTQLVGSDIRMLCRMALQGMAAHGGTAKVPGWFDNGAVEMAARVLEHIGGPNNEMVASDLRAMLAASPSSQEQK